MTISSNTNIERLAKGLGLLSLGLAGAALFAPRSIERWMGAKRGNENVLRAVGARELLSGIGLLSQERPVSWAWSRVVGDLMDISLLAFVFEPRRRRDTFKFRTAIATVAGITAVDYFCAHQLSNTEAGEKTVGVKESIAVNRSPQEVYAFWRRFENLPQIMRHLISVQTIDEKRSHWVASAPGGTKVEWDAEITRDEPGRVIAWRSIGNSDVSSEGEVTFTELPGRGTKVTVQLRYEPPAGMLGAAAAKLFAKAPENEIRDDLRPLKQLLETGEIATVKGQPAGRSEGETWLDRVVS